MPVIESTENIIQLFTTGFCAGLSAYRAFKTGKHAWVLLFFAAFVYFLGDIYWQLYLESGVHSMGLFSGDGSV